MRYVFKPVSSGGLLGARDRSAVHVGWPRRGWQESDRDADLRHHVPARGRRDGHEGLPQGLEVVDFWGRGLIRDASALYLFSGLSAC